MSWVLKVWIETSGRGLAEYAFLASTFSVLSALAVRYFGPIFSLDGNFLESTVLTFMNWLRGGFFLW